jgi:hypothetical protein
MASKKPGTAVAVKSSNAAVVKAEAGLPDYLKGYQGPTGTEDIEANDLVIPRIKVAQGTSDEVKDGTLKEGTLFLNLTKAVLAEPGKPLLFVPLWRGKEYILWRPRKDNGGGILARARKVVVDGQTRYQWDKPNTTFDVKVDGKIAAKWSTKKFIDEDGLDQWGSEIPGNADSGIAATAHHNYVVVLPELDGMVAALSLSRSQAKKAKNFNSLLKLGSAPLWARLFNAVTVDEQNDQGKFKNVDIAANGFVSAEDFSRYADMAKGFAGKTIVVDQSDDDEDAASDGKL